MGRLLIDEIRSIEGTEADPSTLGAMVVRLILSSRRIEARVHESDPRTGVYVVVLEGTLEISDRERVADRGVAASPADSLAPHNHTPGTSGGPDA